MFENKRAHISLLRLHSIKLFKHSSACQQLLSSEEQFCIGKISQTDAEKNYKTMHWTLIACKGVKN